jgi:hypothetical protein
MSKPLESLNPATHAEDIDQNLVVSPPNIISPVGDRIRYLANPVGPVALAILVCSF